MLSDVFATGESKILNSLLAGQGRTIECRQTKKTKNKTINQFITDINCTNHIARQADTKRHHWFSFYGVVSLSLVLAQNAAREL